ncbi:HSP20-like chaperone [Phascolomyces articulosus]|uniref:HSP20-like chaperone n=1 Tax=Phascolomyces articulosus TaxID=60185 RepID=A0AAD5PD80_9FUNG|nr:HSP20-like chaperone [Phascolomyces articulosus]
MSMINWGSDSGNIERRMNNLFERFFDSSPRARSLAERFDTGISPAFDVTENDQAFNIHAELPGMKKEDIHVDVHGDRLTFSGESKASNEYENENVCYSERRYGRFSRSVPVPENVDKSQIKASFKDGVLDLEMPKSSKSENTEAQKITVD